MQRNGLGDLPLEIYEQILTMVSHQHTPPNSTLTLALDVSR
jgi:hypothetical protein